MTDTTIIKGLDRSLAAIRARAAAATPGPWRALGTGRAGGDHWYVCDENQSLASIACNDGENEDQREPDAVFIARAREDVPALLDEVDRLRAALAEVAKHQEDMADSLDDSITHEQIHEQLLIGMRLAADARG